MNEDLMTGEFIRELKESYKKFDIKNNKILQTENVETNYLNFFYTINELIQEEEIDRVA